MSEKAVISIHWSFWAVGALGLIYNLLGCVNFVSQMDAEAIASMPDVYRAIVESRPAWGTAAFALAVFGGLLGCLLLLLRKSAAFYVLIVSVVAAVAAQIPYFGMVNLPSAAWIGWLSQVAVGAFLVWYSTLAKSRNWIS
ncbi:MAG: hypothetical protein KJP17_01975 [Gammaproteobacteria bacterium]|nr:hypothetical protein [Gammaproteobacteria bacterium]